MIKAFEFPDHVTTTIIQIARDYGVGVALHQVDNLRFESTDEQIKIINRNLPGELLRLDDLFTAIPFSPVVKFTLWSDHEILMKAQEKFFPLESR